MKKKILIVIGMFLFQYSFGQDSSNSIVVGGLDGVHAFSTYPNALKGSFRGLFVGYQIVDDASWAQALNVEDIRISSTYKNTSSISLVDIPGSQGVLGNSYNLVASLDIVVIKINTTTLVFSPGFGLAYQTKSCGSYDDQVISGSLDGVSRIGLVLQTYLNDLLSVEYGINFDHTSSGGLKLPNCGTNTTSALIALIYHVGESNVEMNDWQLVIDDHTKWIQLDGDIGRRDFMKTGYYRYNNTGYYYQGQHEGSSDLYQYTIDLHYNNKINDLFSVIVGPDLTYIAHPFEGNNHFLTTYAGSYSSYSHEVVGIASGGSLWLGKLVISATAGYDVYARYLYTQKLYYVVGMEYFLTHTVALNGKANFNNTEMGYPSIGLSLCLY